MEETVLVIMLRDPQTGFLEKELMSLNIGENEAYIYNTYAAETENGTVVVLKLTCGREVEDWEFNAIYDYYDEETLMPHISSIAEDEDAYDPTWIVTLPYVDNVDLMEEKILEILDLHKQEMDSVYEAIKDQKEAYTDNE